MSLISKSEPCITYSGAFVLDTNVLRRFTNKHTVNLRIWAGDLGLRVPGRIIVMSRSIEAGIEGTGNISST